MKRCAATCLALTVLISGVGFAQDGTPIVRVDIDPDTVAVGESARLRVTVLVPTWFPQPPVYPDFELANAITRLPPDSSNPTSERIGGENWSGIVRNYRVYPLTGATYRISGETLGVTWANPGAEPFRENVAIPDVEFRATVPAGAEALDPYLAGTSLVLTMQVEGSTEGLEAGDAVVLRYTAELDGLPAIFLPPLAPEIAIDGVAVYADAPEIDDGPPARRSEKITLVFDAGGEFTVPAVTLDFWNLQSESVETVSADGVSLNVAGPPVEPAADPGDTAPADWRTIALIAALVLVSGGAIRRGWPRWRERFRDAHRRRQASEAFAFHELQASLKAERAEQAFRRLMTWTDRLEPPMASDEFARRFGDEALQASLEAWHAALFADGVSQGDLDAVATGLARARERYRRQERSATRDGLPPLNPA